ncbi:MAG: hypothetical protein H7124_18345 [Phycisphaerales bacterium]|nr:hypothetical protein [Hyphomonadaceae bacterium]
MLRTLALALMLSTPSLAFADDFPASATQQVVRGHDGSEIGRIADAEYDADGNIVAVAIPGLEPADAPYASSRLVAENRLRTPTRSTAAAPASVRMQEARATGRLVRAR